MAGALPPLYVSFGMSKSGSTYAFELTKKLLAQHGLAQPRLTNEAVRERDHINYSERWDDERVAVMIAEADAVPTTIVVKTHQPPTNAIVHRMLAGEVVGHVVYRDPRDAALSLLDAGRAARERGSVTWADFRTLDDVLAKIDAQVDSLRAWAALPAFDAIDFGTLTTDDAALAGLLTRQTDLDFEPGPAVADVLDHEFIQFNQGIQVRHRDEMSRRDSKRFRLRYADFYDRFLPWVDD